MNKIWNCRIVCKLYRNLVTFYQQGAFIPSQYEDMAKYSSMAQLEARGAHIHHGVTPRSLDRNKLLLFDFLTLLVLRKHHMQPTQQRLAQRQTKSAISVRHILQVRGQ